MRRSIKPVVVYLFFLLVIGGLIFSDHQHRRQEEAQVDKVDRTSQASDVEKNKVIEDRLAKMTLEEKVGQLFWARVPDNHQIEDLQSYHCLVISYSGGILRAKP